MDPKGRVLEPSHWVVDRHPSPGFLTIYGGTTPIFDLLNHVDCPQANQIKSAGTLVAIQDQAS